MNRGVNPLATFCRDWLYARIERLGDLEQGIGSMDRGVNPLATFCGDWPYVRIERLGDLEQGLAAWIAG